MNKIVFLLLLAFSTAAAQTVQTDNLKVKTGGKIVMDGQTITDIETVMPSTPTDAQLLTAKGVRDYVTTSSPVQVLTRTSASNDVSLSGGGGSIKINDYWEQRAVTWSNGSATATISGTIPSNSKDIFVTLDGLHYTVGTSGCSDCNVAISGSTLTFPRNLVTGETLIVKIAKQ